MSGIMTDGELDMLEEFDCETRLEHTLLKAVRAANALTRRLEAERDELKAENEKLKEQNDHLKAFLATDY